MAGQSVLRQLPLARRSWTRVRRSTAALCAATNATKYPIQRPMRLFREEDDHKPGPVLRVRRSSKGYMLTREWRLDSHQIRDLIVYNSVTFAEPQLSASETVYPKRRLFFVFRG